VEADVTVRRMSYPDILAQQVRYAGLPMSVREHKFHATRKWRFDLCWPGYWLAVEVDGGGFMSGRHSRGTGMEKDAEKFAEAAIAGWTVLRVTPRQVTSGTALGWIERWFAAAERRRR